MTITDDSAGDSRSVEWLRLLDVFLMVGEGQITDEKRNMDITGNQAIANYPDLLTRHVTLTAENFGSGRAISVFVESPSGKIIDPMFHIYRDEGAIAPEDIAQECDNCGLWHADKAGCSVALC